MTVLSSDMGTEYSRDYGVGLADAVWSRLDERIEGKLGELELITSHLFERSLNQSEVASAISLAGAVASAYGVLGLGTGADLLRKASDILDSPEPGAQVAIEVASLLEDARVMTASMVADIKLQQRTGGPIAIVGEESELVDMLVWVALAQGLAVVRYDGADAPEHSDPESVEGVILVTNEVDPKRGGSITKGIRQVFATQPIIAVSPRSDAEAIATLAGSVSLVIPSSVHPGQVISELRQSIVRASYGLSVGLIGKSAPSLSIALSDRGFRSTLFASVDELIEAAASDRCRAVLIGHGIPGFDQVDVLRLLRTDRRTRATVVAIADNDPSLAKSHHCLRQGADLYLPADVDTDDLSLWIRSLLTRRGEIEPVADKAALVGLTPWPAGQVIIERMLMSAFRSHQPVGVGVVGMGEKSRDGKSLDHLIANEFRNEDVVSRLDDHALVVVLAGVDLAIMKRRMDEIHSRYDLSSEGARSGVVEFPADGRSLDELVLSAQALIAGAEDTDGPEVVDSGWEADASSATDILMVDPDDTLGTVLAAALGRRGISVEVQPDALDALDHLTGIGGRPLPKLVLLELDLLGLDGLAFLRKLREAGTLSRFKVIVLSSRSRESDLRQAFELGADDYVSKPFSTPLLLHRLTRVLGS